MPVNLTDRKLATLYRGLETQRQTNPNVKIGDQQALSILAAVGDSFQASGTRVAAELARLGGNTDAQVALTRRGLSTSERADLAKILDSGTVPLEPSARALLEAVLGRTPVAPEVGGLRISGDQRNGFMGVAEPGASIEAINLTAIPSGRLHMDETSVIGKADAGGRFSNLKLPDVQEGDLIRLRSKKADGTYSDWVTLRASGIAPSDARNAVVATFRIGLSDAGGGKIGVTNINASRPVSEPGAVLQLTNTRTGERSKVTIDDKGGFPDGFQVNGKPGDVFAVAASDGKNNTALTTEVGRLTVPGGATGGTDLIKDPALHKDELNSDGTPRFSTKNFTGPLFKDGVSFMDPQQGQIGDCYFPSALAAIARTDPQAIQKMITANGDGTYTVTFKERDWATSRYKDVQVKVDGDLYVRSTGAPLYGATASTDKGQKTMETWFPLVEKAYAAWKGSFDSIGNGGVAGDVMEDVLGVPSQWQVINESSVDRTWATLKTAVDKGYPMSAGTYGADQSARYTNSGVYANHSYTVLGYEEAGGQRYVKLRNPWGESEPSGNGANDGVFRLKLEDFNKLYQGLGWVEG